jgi:peptidoglycan/xylan/chitin deacetylase (PgdA/CDA1 family)
MKNILAFILYYLGISYILFRLVHRKGKIRAVNYHCTPNKDLKNFEKQLKFFKKHFINTDLDTLNYFFNSEHISLESKSRILITFDDGLRSNFDNTINLLEKNGFTGWFCIPAGFVLNPSQNFADNNSIIYKQNYIDKRYGINLTELSLISKKHEIVSHTFSHYRFINNDSEKKLKFELTDSKLVLEKVIEKKISTFCWVGGELDHYTKSAYDQIIDSGYNYSFTTNSKLINKNTDRYNLNRTNIEASYPIHLVLFQLSGIMDFIYIKKRLNVKFKFLHL